MARSDSSNIAGICGSEQEEKGHKARFSVENIRARDKHLRESAEPQWRSQYHRGKLHLTSCDWQQFLEMEERAEDIEDLLDGILVF